MKLGIPRSTVYAQRVEAAPPAKPGSKPRVPDSDRLHAIRSVLTAPPSWTRVESAANGRTRERPIAEGSPFVSRAFQADLRFLAQGEAA